MKKNSLLISVAFAIFFGGCATATAEQGAIKAKAEVVIYEVCDKVWPIIKNFGDMHKWHPAVVSTESHGGNSPGAARILTLGNGKKIYESLTKYSSKAMSMSYVITSMDAGALPVKNYASRLRLEKEGSRCEVDWSGSFDSASPSMTDAEVKNAIHGVYMAGLKSIEKRMMMK